MHFLIWGGIALAGFATGFFLVTKLSAIILTIIWGIAAWLWVSTKDAELGAVAGILAVVAAVAFTVGLAIAYAIVYGLSVDLSWALRPGVV